MKIKAIAAAIHMTNIAHENFAIYPKFSESADDEYYISLAEDCLSKTGTHPRSAIIVATELNETLSATELLAAAAHMANRSYCISIGDESQPLWSQAPEWQRNSAIAGVSGVLSGNTPEKSHKSWMEEKLRTGWKYGPVKDPNKKEHPCMVDFDDLPESQKIKDVIFTETVREVYYALTGDRPWKKMTRAFAASFHVFLLSRLISTDKTVLQIGEEKYEISHSLDGIHPNWSELTEESRKHLENMIDDNYEVRPFDKDAIAEIAYSSKWTYANNTGHPIPYWQDLSQESQSIEKLMVIAAIDGCSPKWIHEQYGPKKSWHDLSLAEKMNYTVMVESATTIHGELH